MPTGLNKDAKVNYKVLLNTRIHTDFELKTLNENFEEFGSLFISTEAKSLTFPILDSTSKPFQFSSEGTWRDVF
jgi:hypothetical protein